MRTADDRARAAALGLAARGRGSRRPRERSDGDRRAALRRRTKNEPATAGGSHTILPRAVGLQSARRGRVERDAGDALMHSASSGRAIARRSASLPRQQCLRVETRRHGSPMALRGADRASAMANEPLRRAAAQRRSPSASTRTAARRARPAKPDAAALRHRQSGAMHRAARRAGPRMARDARTPLFRRRLRRCDSANACGRAGKHRRLRRASTI